MAHVTTANDDLGNSSEFPSQVRRRETEKTGNGNHPLERREMFQVTIGRKQYDALVERFPRFMSEDWCKFKRRWCLGGVIVNTDHEGYAHALKSNLEVVDAAIGK